jgi:WD40 repeat protein
MRLRLIFCALSTLITGCATTEPPPIYLGSGFTRDFSAAAFSPDGKLAATANHEAVWVFDTESHHQVASFSSQYRSGTVNTIAFLDENRLVTTLSTSRRRDSSAKAAVAVWNLDQENQSATIIDLPELGHFSISLATSHATGAFAVGGENGEVALLKPDGSGGFTKVILPGLDGPVLDLVFSRERSALAVAGKADSIVIWDTESLSEIGRLPGNNAVYDLSLIPNERRLIAAGDDLMTWQFLGQERLDSIENPSKAGDMVVIGAGAAAFVAVAWPIAIPTLIEGLVDHEVSGNDYAPNYGFCSRVIAVSPDGSMLVDIHPGLLKEKIRVIDLRSRSVMRSLNPKGGRSCGAAFSPDGSKLLIVNSRVARLYDVGDWSFSDFEVREPVPNR